MLCSAILALATAVSMEQIHSAEEKCHESVGGLDFLKVVSLLLFWQLLVLIMYFFVFWIAGWRRSGSWSRANQKKRMLSRANQIWNPRRQSSVSPLLLVNLRRGMRKEANLMDQVNKHTLNLYEVGLQFFLIQV